MMRRPGASDGLKEAIADNERCTGITFDSEDERCQHIYKMSTPPKDKPNFSIIPYEDYREKYCGLKPP